MEEKMGEKLEELKKNNQSTKEELSGMNKNMEDLKEDNKKLSLIHI